MGFGRFGHGIGLARPRAALAAPRRPDHLHDRTDQSAVEPTVCDNGVNHVVDRAWVVTDDGLDQMHTAGAGGHGPAWDSLEDSPHRVRRPTPQASWTTVNDEVVQVRREVHRHPELAFEELRTAALVTDRLERLGLSRSAA